MFTRTNLLGITAQLGKNVRKHPDVHSFSHSLPSDFQVTAPLPNVTWTLPRNWAGNIQVQRAGHVNDTLFFWAFEKENGSLTAGPNENSDKPWGIWLNGYFDGNSFGIPSSNKPSEVPVPQVWLD
jgi:carboxypeptidase D